MDYFKDLQFIRSAHLPRRDAYHPRRTFDNYYTLHYCHAGDFFLKIDDGPEEKSSTPCAFLTFPGSEFTYGNPHEPYHYLYVCFRGALAEQWLEGGLLCCLHKNPLIPILNSVDFFNKFARLITLLHSPDRSSNHARAVLLLAELLLQITEQQQKQLNYRNPFAKKMNDLIKEIHHSPELEWDFRHEAKQMKISYSYFRKVFEELYNEPPHNYLLQCRLQKAEYLLTDNELQIQEIAVLCGFQDKFYFSRLFKKNYGMSPMKYRKEHLLEL